MTTVGRATARGGGLDAGMIGAIGQLFLSAALTLFLLVATDSSADALPRPIVLGTLYATPGAIGLMGARANRRSLLVGAAIPLIPGALLSWAGLTLIFLVPAALLLAGAVAPGAPAQRPLQLVLGSVRAVLLATLIIAAGWAVLLGLTAEACVSIPGGIHCSSAAITVEGLLVAAACLVAAVVIAAWTARSGRSTA